jgi:hypothetical protein
VRWSHSAFIEVCFLIYKVGIISLPYFSQRDDENQMRPLIHVRELQKEYKAQEKDINMITSVIKSIELLT